MSRFTHIWYWRCTPQRPIDRKGQPCRIVATGRMNSALIEFPDGFRVLTNRWAVRRA